MGSFNKNSRTNNVLKSSFAGSFCSILNALMGFVYRTIFLYFFTEEYLGLNGLFTGILQLLSLTDLGITSAITFRFYEPINNNDIQKVGQLLRFFKTVYLVIAGAIFVLGMSMVPFLDFFINDASEVPADIDLRVIYILFLFQTLSTYLFSYKLTILTADQKQYIVSLIQTGIGLLRYIFQVVSLVIWRDFTITLILGISTTVISNYLFSLWVTKSYAEVFRVKGTLSKQERRSIYSDTRATMCHKIGGTILTSTDNVILSKFSGLAVLGFYSNYSLIISSVNSILSQLLGNFTSSLGSVHVSMNRESALLVYKRMLFLNLWISSMVTVCVYSLINDFIIIWLGERMLLDQFVVMVLCIQFFLQLNRKITTSYIDGCGLFVKDKFRPLIEAALNLGVSIVLTKYIGVAGVFLGTIISCLATVFWREPFILFKHEFKKSTKDYWIMYIEFSALTVAFSVIFDALKDYLITFETTIGGWVLQAICCALLFNIIAALVFLRKSEFKFYYAFIKSFVRKRLKLENPKET